MPKNNHQGMFPAIFCLKIVGKNSKLDFLGFGLLLNLFLVQTYERLVIRACAMTSMDNQCGVFKYEDSEMSGCVLTCDYSGCNTGLKFQLAFPLLVISWVLSVDRVFGIFSGSR